MPAEYDEFRVVLRYIQLAAGTASATRPDFLAIVSARNLDDAKLEADKVVEILEGVVAVVAITRL